MKLRGGGRSLLNRPGHHSTGSVIFEVQDTRDAELNGRYVPVPEYTFAISDCSRTIHLELDWTTPEGRENSLFKIDTLIAHLREGRKAVVAEQKLYEKRKAKVDADD